MSGHYSVAFDDHIFIFGDEGTQNVFSYDISKAQWSQLPPLLLGPAGRAVYALDASGVVAYQQGPARDGEHYMDHGLFKVSRECLCRAAVPWLQAVSLSRYSQLRLGSWSSTGGV